MSTPNNTTHAEQKVVACLKPSEEPAEDSDQNELQNTPKRKREDDAELAGRKEEVPVSPSKKSKTIIVDSNDDFDKAKPILPNCQKKRAEMLMEANIQKCTPYFRTWVAPLSKEISVGQTNTLFRLLDEFQCPMEESVDKHSVVELDYQRLLRWNNSGYKKLERALLMPKDVSENKRAARLEKFLDDMIFLKNSFNYVGRNNAYIRKYHPERLEQHDDALVNNDSQETLNKKQEDIETPDKERTPKRVREEEHQEAEQHVTKDDFKYDYNTKCAYCKEEDLFVDLDDAIESGWWTTDEWYFCPECAPDVIEQQQQLEKQN
jgi:hypothetical protein